MINKLLPSNTSPEKFARDIAITPKKILSGNSKLRKDKIFNITLPAYNGYYLLNGKLTKQITCPSASACLSVCYAGLGGTYGFSASMIKHSRNLNYMLNNPFEFANQLVSEISKIKNLRAIRWNDSGDFFSEGYWGVAKEVMKALPHVNFYAYTKMVQFFKSRTDIPSNFTLIYSYGGKHDPLINPEDRHARIFSSRATLRKAGYSDGTHTDRLAANPKFTRIGLVVHGNWLAMHKLRKRAKTMEASHA